MTIKQHYYIVKKEKDRRFFWSWKYFAWITEPTYDCEFLTERAAMTHKALHCREFECDCVPYSAVFA